MMARAGDKSLHGSWLAGGSRNFDLYLSYYGATQGKFAQDGDFWREQPGPKWPVLHGHVQEEKSLIRKYDAVWFPDDDLLMDAPSISRMFDFFMAFEFCLAQPSLSHESFFSHSAVLRDPSYAVRFTNFVEVMGPVFSREALDLLHPTFDQSRTGWGLDYLWPHLIAESGISGRIGLIDAVSMTHTRPVGGGDLYRGQVDPGRKDMEILRRLYPSARIDSRMQRGSFAIFGGAKLIGPRSGFLARLSGRIFRHLAKRKALSVKKHGS